MAWSNGVDQWWISGSSGDQGKGEEIKKVVIEVGDWGRGEVRASPLN